MNPSGPQPGSHRSRLVPAQLGAGPLLQRDYWAVIEQCRLDPARLVRRVADHFEHFPPRELARFERRRPGPLEVGDTLAVHIFGAGDTEVQVIHQDALSFTLATVQGHPEAGRITFGAYRNRRGDVIFHVRSRARSSSRLKRLGFLGVGEPMQTATWTDLIDHVAADAGRGVIGWIHAETRPCADEPEEQSAGTPTFYAREPA